MQLPYIMAGPCTELLLTCTCGTTLSVDHALLCPKDGLLSLCHNEISDLTASLLTEVCHQNHSYKLLAIPALFLYPLLTLISNKVLLGLLLWMTFGVKSVHVLQKCEN